MKGCADADESLLCYKKWSMEGKLVGEVIADTTWVKAILMKTQRRFPCQETKKKWDIQEMHRVFMMKTTHQL